jgi:phenol 2-monooxygenase
LEVVCSKTSPYLSDSVVELIVIHPFSEQRFEWTDIPTCIKENAEMRFHGVGIDDVYGKYGVDVKKGAITVVRPDGYLGLITGLSDAHIVSEYLKGCLYSAI